eukprot:COSAG04_NODE_2169_length_4640_cov_1.647875_1_plen_140_part_10
MVYSLAGCGHTAASPASDIDPSASCTRRRMRIVDRKSTSRGMNDEEPEPEMMEMMDQVILPTAPAVSNEGGSSELLALLPAVSWPRVSAWGSLEPPRRDGENAQKTGKNGGKMGEIRPKTCEGRGLTKDQLADARDGAGS